jgi:hypothetical protein
MNPFTAELAAERIRDLHAAAARSRTRAGRRTHSTRYSTRRSSR